MKQRTWHSKVGCRRHCVIKRKNAVRGKHCRCVCVEDWGKKNVCVRVGVGARARVCVYVRGRGCQIMAAGRCATNWCIAFSFVAKATA